MIGRVAAKAPDQAFRTDAAIRANLTILQAGRPADIGVASKANADQPPQLGHMAGKLEAGTPANLSLRIQKTHRVPAAGHPPVPQAPQNVFQPHGRDD